MPGADGTVQQVPLGQVATIRPAIGPARIDHLDRERVITVQANTEDRPLQRGDQRHQRAAGRRSTLPPGYALTQGGETEDQAEVFGRILAALGSR